MCIRDRLCALVAYVLYRDSVFSALGRVVDQRVTHVWCAATDFAEAWLQREAFPRHLLLCVAYIQYEPVLDEGDDHGPAESDYSLTAADAEAELRPPPDDAAEPDEPDPELDAAMAATKPSA